MKSITSALFWKKQGKLQEIKMQEFPAGHQLYSNILTLDWLMNLHFTLHR